MKRHILMALGAAFLASPAVAAADLSGSWFKDNAKSDPVPPTLMLRDQPQGRGGGGGGGAMGRGGPGAGGGGRGGGRGANAPMPMVVAQNGSSLQVTESQGGVRKYALDGKPHTIEMDTGVQRASVTAAWEGDALVISTTEPYGGMPGNVTAQVKEVWSLSPDGKTLTIATTRTIPAVERTYKEVYSRQ
jgi:hypothetical protein